MNPEERTEEQFKLALLALNQAVKAFGEANFKPKYSCQRHFSSSTQATQYFQEGVEIVEKLFER
jgi:hypothetical protein